MVNVFGANEFSRFDRDGIGRGRVHAKTLRCSASWMPWLVRCSLWARVPYTRRVALAALFSASPLAAWVWRPAAGAGSFDKFQRLIG